LDPTLPVIKVSIVNNKIVRVLPTVGQEEWISDKVRFLTLTAEKNPSSKTYLTQSPTFNIKTSKLQETTQNQKKNTKEKEKVFTTLNIEKNCAIDLEMYSISAIKEYSTIRVVDYLNQQLNINIQRATTLNIPDIDDFDDEDLIEPKDFNDYTVFLQTNFRNIQPMLEININSFVDNGGELYALTLAETTTTTDYLGFSQKTWEKILNGHNKTQKTPLFL